MCAHTYVHVSEEWIWKVSVALLTAYYKPSDTATLKVKGYLRNIKPTGCITLLTNLLTLLNTSTCEASYLVITIF